MIIIKTFLILLLGFIGVVIGAGLLAIGNDNATFQTKFIFKLCGLVIFVGTIFLVQRYWKQLNSK